MGLEQCDIDAAERTAKERLPNMNFGAGSPRVDYAGMGWYGEAQIPGRKPNYDGYIHLNTMFLKPLDERMQRKILETYYHEAGHFTWPEAYHDVIFPYAAKNAEASWERFKTVRSKLCKCGK
ncbi:hypothetical protein [Rugamonas aquatica]|uniref:Uncharacterized protein n=1 Tax=Rugamonas aquatica TaxID=2743357 RepID=A0A6A7N5H8_9BURK|nr:hypothetical protein [Rugamonas aquatica]MQA40161.1 hypothetical protein [Rugamonas aquatica]